MPCLVSYVRFGIAIDTTWVEAVDAPGAWFELGRGRCGGLQACLPGQFLGLI
jgi:hypothetical protein